MDDEAKKIFISNNDFVSITELNQVISDIGDIRGRFVVIKFLNEIARIDIVFIAGLYLLNQERGLWFNLSGSIGDRGELFNNKSAEYELKNYLAHIEYLYGPSTPKWISAVEYSKADVKAARVYSPILYICDETLDCLFRDKENVQVNDLKMLFINSLNQKANQIEKAFYSETPENHIVNRLISHAPVYTFVYCILHVIDSPFVGNEDGLAEAIKRIDRIWSFTVRYVAGIYELAKNIVKHSSEKKGVISLRAYRSSEENDSDRIIETYVFDYGSEGIVPTMIKEIDLEFGPDHDLPAPEDFVDRDILLDHYSLQKFFSPGKAYRLSRQFRREMAHLGLLHFMSMIHSNKGTCWISTGGIDNNGRDTFGDDVLKDKQIMIGTNFHFSLPMSRHFSSEIESIETPVSTTREAIAAMPRIYTLRDQITVIRLKSEIPIVGDSFFVDDRGAEKTVVEAIRFDQLSSPFLAFDFEGLSFSPTSLLRVLAMVSESTDKGVIVLNIATETLSQMIESNEIYFKTMDEVESVPFWIKDRSILVYSKMKMDDSDFYFVDILYGGSPESFYSVNKVVSNSFPNYVTIASTNEVGVIEKYYHEHPVSSFFVASTLLPFDMVLLDVSGKYLFDYNLMSLVNKRLV